jgi:hypothetical protein
MTAFPVIDKISGWSLAPVTPPPLAARVQAVLIAQLVDEITAMPPLTRLSATTETAGIAARATAGGLAGLVGQPLTRFGPGFVTGAPLQLTLTGRGYLPISVTAKIGPEPLYPAAFTPVALGTIALHRTPVSLAARTVSRTRTVRAGTTVTLEGIWPALADLASASPAPPNLVALASPLYADRGSTATIARQNLSLAPPAEAKVLLRPGNAGSMSVRISDRVSLVPGSIIALDPQDPGRAEYLTVTALTDTGATADQPATLALAFPLTRRHVAGAAAIRAIPAVAGPANSLARTARAGDVALFPSVMAGLDNSMNAVVISGGAADEHHIASLVSGSSDALGYVRLPPLHRVAQLRLRAHHPAEPADLLQDVMLPFGVAGQTLDLVFP